MLADAICVWRRVKFPNENVAISCGVDEHGIKVAQAAAQSNCMPLQFCDRMSALFKNLVDAILTVPNVFLRTTDASHAALVFSCWNVLREKGLIYKGSYSGWYSVADEAFVSVPSFALHRSLTLQKQNLKEAQLQFVSEANYFFKIGPFIGAVEKWLSKDSVTPDFYAKVSRDFMQSSANEVSISRLKSAYKWGLPVPLDSEHVIHVWFEALLSYFTAARQLASGQNSESFEVLPPNLQIIGKDILNFHTLTFPGMCFALGLQPSAKILCHLHWTVNGEKMSKRSGNSIDPMPLIVKYSADALRYYMFKDGRLMSDADFSISRLQALYKDDLIDKIGNLFTRILNPKLLSHVPAEFCIQTKNSSLSEAKHKFVHAIDRHYENFEFNRAVDCVLEFVKQINAHINHSQIWTFTHKHAAKSNFLNDFGEIYDLLKVLCICLLPILPSKAAAVLKLLGVSVRDQTFQQLLDQNVARTIRLDASDALCASVRFEKTQ